MRPVREALAGLRRAPLLGGLSILAIGLSLLVIGLFGLTARNIHLALTGVESHVEVVGYLQEGTDEEKIRLARNEISRFPEVEEVRYVSKVEALFNASRELTEFSDVFSDLDVNPLPASLEVGLRPGFRTPTHVEAVATRLAGYEFVEDVRYGREWVDRVYALRRIAGGAALVLGGAFAGGAVLLIGIAVRMAILARSKEIAIMQTVGATDGYIRRPFLFEGMLAGLAGGGVALGLTWVTRAAVERSLSLSIAWLPDLWIVGGLLGAGLLGVGAAARAVRRELRRVHES
ncbi:MAG: cell division protein FtsX [Gemmatimonadota bacterium]